MTILFASCKIYSFTGISISPEVKTVTVENIINNANNVNPTLAQTVTEKMKDKFSQEARLDLLERNGDVLFVGAITGYDVRPAASGAGDRAELNRLTISMSVDYVNNVEDKNWSKSFTQYENFDRNANLSAVEDQLIEEITDRMVADIFAAAFSDW
ncbi:MAG: LPS assembly lipoprotein LptE [Chitinophagales bacterium]